jgi:hypothetical protein
MPAERPQAPATAGGLSPARRRLLRVMARIGFGEITGLRVRGGEPCFEPPPRAVRVVKLGCAADPGPGPDVDFALKAQVVELFERLDELGDGVVESIEVRHGLPCLLRLAAPA